MDRLTRLPFLLTGAARSNDARLVADTGRRWALAAVFFLGLLIIAVAVPQAGHTAGPQPAITPDEVADAVRSVLRGSTYQTELPGAGRATVDGATAGPRDRPPDLRPEAPQPWQTPSAVESLAKVSLWILAAVVLIVLCFWLTGLVPGRRASRANPSALQADGSGSKVRTGDPPDALADADRLARSGDFDGAIHCLLLAALERLRGILDQPIAPSLTGREVVDRSGPAAGVQAALRTLVMSVEISRFGGRAADADVYDRCRESFRHLSASAGSAA